MVVFFGLNGEVVNTVFVFARERECQLLPKPAVAGMKKRQGRGTESMSSRELKTGPELLLSSPFVNLAGDVLLGKQRLVFRRPR